MMKTNLHSAADRLIIVQSLDEIVYYLRNDCNIWKVHGIMNTSGLVQSK